MIVVAVSVFLYRHHLAGWARWQEVLAAWDQEGRWHWKEIVEDRPHVPDGENLALIIQQLAKRLDAAKLYREADDLLFRHMHSHPQCRISSAALAVLQRRSKDAEEFLRMLPRLENAPYRSRMLIPQNQEPFMMPLYLVDASRAVMNHLNDELWQNLEKQDIPAAQRKLLAMNKLAFAISQEPGVIHVIVTRAMLEQQLQGIQRLLAQGECTPAQLQELSDSLNPFDAMSHWKRALFCEAASSYSYINMIRDKSIPASRLFGENDPDHWWEYPTFWIKDVYFSQQIRSYHQRADTMQMMLDVYRQADQPWTRQRQFLQTLTEQSRAEVKTGKVRLKNYLVPAHDKTCVTEMQKIAQLRCVQVALAAEQFRMIHQRWPASLKELSLPAATLLDPFTDQPLHLKATPFGLVIYSVGPDNKDDDGKVIPQLGQPTPDLGFALWNVNERRQPAIFSPLLW
jgi:hypothetical protein